jgi:hypothetical protein
MYTSLIWYRICRCVKGDLFLENYYEYIYLRTSHCLPLDFMYSYKILTPTPPPSPPYNLTVWWEVIEWTLYQYTVPYKHAVYVCTANNIITL